VLGSNYKDMDKFFSSHGVEVRPMFCDISEHGHFQKFQSSDNAKMLRKECVILPSYPDLTNNEIQHVVNVLKKYKRIIDE